MSKNNSGIIIGIIGISLSIFFYIQTKSYSSIALIKNPITTTLIENNANAENVNVFIDSTLIESNLHSLYFYLFNNGDVKLSGDEIREPILVSLDSNIIIHKIKIVKTTHPNTQFQIGQIDNNTIQILFKELYPNDGITCQIIFEGNKDTEINTSSYIIGIDKISDKPISSYRFYFYVTLCFICLFLLLLLYMKMKGDQVAREDKAHMEKIEKSKEKEPKQSITNNHNDSKFVRIMNIVAPIIMVSILVGLLILAYYLIENVIFQNPELFIPDKLKIKVGT